MSHKPIKKGDQNKAWSRYRPKPTRSINTKSERETFLIVCEGKRTEPSYFNAFRLTSATVRTEGLGMNTLSLVNRCIALVNQHRGRGDSYDQVWCVFDRDSFPPQDFNQAIILAEANNIRVAWSNEAFELWYVLHFGLLQTACNRHQYIDQLNKHLGKAYAKNDPNMYTLLLQRQADAIHNAEQLMQHWQGLAAAPANQCPNTRVHELVQELNRFL